MNQGNINDKLVTQKSRRKTGSMKQSIFLINRLKYIMFFIAISACTSFQNDGIPMNENVMPLQETLNEIEPSATISITEPPILVTTKISNNVNYPLLALNVSPGPLNTCSYDNYNQILVLGYPYTSVEFKLSDKNIDYNFPQWSPDGEWISYITSTIEEEPNPDNGYYYGFESVWVMNNDGSDKRKISQDFNRIDESYNYCERLANLFFHPIWSPDSRYLIYGYFSIFTEEKFELYIHDLITDEIRLIDTGLPGPILWVDNNHFILKDAIGVRYYTIDSLDTLWFQRISYPSYLSNDNSPPKFGDFSQFRGNLSQPNHIIGSFYVRIGTQRWEYDTLQKLEIQTGNWISIKDMLGEEWGNPLIGIEWAVACSRDGTVTFLDTNSWEIIDSYKYETQNLMYQNSCNQLRLFEDKLSSNQYVSFVVHERDYDKLKISTIQDQNIEIIDEVDIKVFDEFENYNFIVDYSWQP